MFSKVALFVTAAFAVSALATPISGSCNSGPVQCCSTLYAPESAEATNVLAGLVGVVIDSITAQVGVECSPITVIGRGSGASWYVLSSLVCVTTADDCVFLSALLAPFAARETTSVCSLF
jgi:hypothetical protein